MAQLDTFGKQNQILFALKPHENLAVHFQSHPQLVYNNVLLIDSVSDVYPILPLVNILVTDYSSIYFDFLLLDKPIIFFPYDIEKYLKQDREFYFNYDEVTPGVKVRSIEELVRCIEATLHNDDHYAEIRKKLADRFFTHRDGRSAQRVASSIFGV
jgi:CDP-glycerol glycerophosphotransferase